MSDPPIATPDPRGAPRARTARVDAQAAMGARRPLWLAHRGDHRRHRENTLDAFHSARAIPRVDGIELDVRVSKDGRLVVLHDPTLERVFGVEAAAANLTGDDLATLGVPSLTDVLAAMPPPVYLDIELKEDVAAAAVEAIRASRGDPPASLVVSSFEADVLRSAARLAPTWPRWLNADELSERVIGLALELGCSGASIALAGLDPSGVADALRSGLDVAAWTVRTTEQAMALDGLDLVAICVEGDVLDERRQGTPDQASG